MDPTSKPLGLRIDGLPFSGFHIRLIVFCWASLLVGSMNYLGIVNPILQALIEEYDLRGSMDFIRSIAILSGSPLYGLVIGAPLFGYLADRIGRWLSIQVALLVSAIATGLSTLSPDWVTFAVFRSLAGLGLGGLVPAGIAYLSEFTPPTIRGRVVSWYGAMYPIGYLLGGLLGSLLLPYGWRGVLIVIALLTMLIMILGIGLPESVRYLLRRGNIDRATEIVEKLEREILGNESVGSNGGDGPAIIRSTGDMARSLAIIFLTWAMLGFSTYGITLQSIPIIILKDVYPHIHIGGLYMGAFIASMSLGYIIAGFSNDYTGRRSTLVYMLLLTCLSSPLLFLGIGPLSPLLPLIIHGVAMGGIWGSLYAYCSELLPTSTRATVIGLASILPYLPMLFGAIFIGYVSSTIGMLGVLMLNITLVASSAFIVLSIGIETRGKTLE
jgi:putative MFS transporter